MNKRSNLWSLCLVASIFGGGFVLAMEEGGAASSGLSASGRPMPTAPMADDLNSLAGGRPPASVPGRGRSRVLSPDEQRQADEERKMYVRVEGLLRVVLGKVPYVTRQCHGKDEDAFDCNNTKRGLEEIDSRCVVYKPVLLGDNEGLSVGRSIALSLAFGFPSQKTIRVSKASKGAELESPIKILHDLLLEMPGVCLPDCEQDKQKAWCTDLWGLYSDFAKVKFRSLRGTNIESGELDGLKKALLSLFVDLTYVCCQTCWNFLGRSSIKDILPLDFSFMDESGYSKWNTSYNAQLDWKYMRELVEHPKDALLEEGEGSLEACWRSVDRALKQVKECIMSEDDARRESLQDPEVRNFKVQWDEVSESAKRIILRDAQDSFAAFQIVMIREARKRAEKEAWCTIQ